MLLNAYTLYDAKALTYSPPFFASAHGAACRMVMDVSADPNTSVGRHPGDFTLFCVGQWNDATGQLLPFEVREHISDVAPLAPRRQQRDLFANSDADNGTESATNGRAS